MIWKATISGGENPPLTTVESGLYKGMSVVFRGQLDKIKENGVTNPDVAWVNNSDWQKEIERVHKRYYSIQIDKSGTTAARNVGVDIADIIERPRVQRAILSDSMKFAQECGRSTIDKLKAALIAVIENGESESEATERVANVFGEGGDQREANWRAQRVARTEISYAATRGDRLGWKESGVVEASVWLASSDACPFCLRMNGKVCGLDSAFLKQGQTLLASFEGQVLGMDVDYRDVIGPPLHPNCRCTTVPKLVNIRGME